jgi:hypothetical protein
MRERSKRDTALDILFAELLGLHKALLDDERVAYERVHGRVPFNGTFLQLVINDAWFAWLRPLSQSIAKLDELSESDDAAFRETIPALLESVRRLLVPMEEGEVFGRHYHDALQRNPDVVLAHARVRALLGSRVPSTGGPLP